MDNLIAAERVSIAIGGLEIVSELELELQAGRAVGVVWFWKVGSLSSADRHASSCRRRGHRRESPDLRSRCVDIQ